MRKLIGFIGVSSLLIASLFPANPAQAGQSCYYGANFARSRSPVSRDRDHLFRGIVITRFAAS